MAKMPSLEETWDESYPLVDHERLWPTEVVPMVAYARRFFRPKAPVLDLPCGDGKNVLALAEIGPVLAADSSERALSLCNATRLAAGVEGIVPMKADVFATPFGDGAFENVFCCDLLGHLPEPERALRELRRVCSATGTAVITLFSEQDSVLKDNRMSKSADGSYWFRDKWYFRFYSDEAARSLAARSGFDVLDCQEFTWWEDAHPGYREYRHEHRSWALALRRAP